MTVTVTVTVTFGQSDEAKHGKSVVQHDRLALDGKICLFLLFFLHFW
jgi:hypothetical protein